jgi:uncharacterized protein
MSNDVFIWKNAKQFSIIQMAIVFVLPSMIAFTGFRLILPKLVENDMPAIIAWPLVASVMLFAFAIFAIFLLKKEAQELNISFRERACLKKLSLKEWGVFVGILILGFISALILGKGSTYLTQVPGLSVPEYFPFFLNPTIDPMNTDPSILTPGFVLKGATWMIPFIALTLFLNILTEELYFRAWVLPKLAKYGKLSWVINGILFAFYHSFQLWLVPSILPVSLVIAFVVYKSKSIWPAFAFHMAVNMVTVLGMMMLILS